MRIGLIIFFLLVSSSTFLLDSFAFQSDPGLSNLRSEALPNNLLIVPRELGNRDTYDVGPTKNSQLWSSQLVSGIEGTPAISSNGTIWIGGLDGKVYSLDNLNGNTIWTSAILGAFIRSSPVLSGDERYLYLTGVSSTSSNVAVVYGLHSFSGDVYFSRNITQTGNTPTAVASRPELFNSSSIMIVALGDTFYSIQLLYLRDALTEVNRSPGDILWQYRVPASKLLSSASILENQVFFTTANRRDVVCLDANTGVECWREALGYYSSSKPEIDALNRMLYVVSSGGIHGIRISETCNTSISGLPSDRTEWFYPAAMPLTSAVYQTARLYFGTQDSTIVCLDLAMGLSPTVRWEFVMNGSLKLSSPVIDATDRCYVTTEAGTVWAFDGSYDSEKGMTPLLWSLTPTPISPMYASPAFGPNNTLLVASSIGRILSLGGFSTIPPPADSSPMMPERQYSDGLSGGAIAGIISASILVCIGIGIAMFIISRKQSPDADPPVGESSQISHSNINGASDPGLTMPEPGTQCSDIEVSEDEETDDISNNAAYRAYLLEFNKHLLDIKGQVQVKRKGRHRYRTNKDAVGDLQYFLTEESLRKATRGSESTTGVLETEREIGEVSEITSPIFSEDETLETGRETAYDEDERPASAFLPFKTSGKSMLAPDPEPQPNQGPKPEPESEPEPELQEFPVPMLQMQMRPVERTRARTFVFDNVSDVSVERPSEPGSSGRSKSQSALGQVLEQPQPQVLLITPKYAPPPVPSSLEQDRQRGHSQETGRAVAEGAQGLDLRRTLTGSRVQAQAQAQQQSLTGTKKRVTTFKTAMSLCTEKPKDAKEP